MRILFLVLFIFPVLLKAQVTDDFSDGNFTADPAWTGDAAQFIVNASGQLQLSSLNADTSSLSTPSTFANDAEWRFWVKLSFATSGNNNARFYLISNQQDLKGPLNGYFVQIGETNDSISIYRQTGTTVQKILRGTIAYTNNTTNTLRIKVTRDAAGTWKLYSDPAGGIAYQLEGTTTDNTFTTSAYMGVWCKYTISNAAKFYFDDIYAGPIVVDITPPTIAGAVTVSPTQLDVYFSEGLDAATSQNTANYNVNNGIGAPASAVRDASNTALVHLTFAAPFTLAQTNTLTVSNVNDVAGNALVTGTVNFVYYIAQKYDVVINEIMADPDPAIGLPNFEYIELHNTTDFPISLENWTITAGTNTKVIPAYTIAPDSFVVLISATGAAAYSASVPVLAVTSFPTLTNSGQTLLLKNAGGQVISAVAYTDAWYGDDAKQDGGWSLEQIDPSNPCSGSSNWRASINTAGGTPGRTNSVRASNPDNASPEIVRVSVITPDTIQVYFSEPLDSTSLSILSAYTIDNGIGNPVLIDPVGPDYTSAILVLSDSLQNGVIYTLTVGSAITDCKGNPVSVNNTARFAIPQTPAPFDIVINEVLADPKTGGTDFVEIYNRSAKVIDLKDLTISTQDTVTGNLEEVEPISETGFLIFPGEYYVISEDGAVIRSQYTVPNAKAFVDIDNLPSMNIEGDVVVIASLSGTIIDKLVYTEDMHFPLLNSTKGVSLERIDFDRPTQDETNWHSASETVGFATPGYRNSQFRNTENTGGEVNVEPEVFSPDNDSYNDVVNINYSFDTPGMVATITIYDSRGRQIRSLTKSELLGSSGTFSWDGVTDGREKARIGVYVIYFEAFSTQGDLKRYKKTCVLGGNL